MRDVTLAKRYAEALFEIAEKKGKLEEVKQQMQTVKQVAEQDASFVTFLTQPKISLNKKRQLIDASFQSFNVEVRNTLKLQVDADRAVSIPAVADAFEAIHQEKMGTAVAVVYSVRALTEDEKQAVALNFAAKLGKRSITIENKIDPSLLGGMKVRIGNTIFDSSIKAKLTRIERNLSNVSK